MTIISLTRALLCSCSFNKVVPDPPTPHLRLRQHGGQLRLALLHLREDGRVCLSGRRLLGRLHLTSLGLQLSLQQPDLLFQPAECEAAALGYTPTRVKIEGICHHIDPICTGSNTTMATAPNKGFDMFTRWQIG